VLLYRDLLAATVPARGGTGTPALAGANGIPTLDSDAALPQAPPRRHRPDRPEGGGADPG
jgi:hypothetical protein